MIKIEQQENLAIGSREDLLSLLSRQSVKLLVLSDSHGNTRVVEDIINNFGHKCDALCFCGDGILDLIKILENGFYDSDFRAKIPPVIFFVKGNGDNSTSTIFTDQRIPITIPEFQEIKIAEKKIFMTHGHRFNVYYGLKDLKAEAISRHSNIVLYGHTHIPNSLRNNIVREDKNELLKILNPGSCSQARGGMPNTFAILNVHTDEDKTFCTYYKIFQNRYDDYNFEEMPTPRGEIKFY